MYSLSVPVMNQTVNKKNRHIYLEQFKKAKVQRGAPQRDDPGRKRRRRSALVRGMVYQTRGLRRWSGHLRRPSPYHHGEGLLRCHGHLAAGLRDGADQENIYRPL